jgi:hypothetical protein
MYVIEYGGDRGNLWCITLPSAKGGMQAGKKNSKQ